MAENPLSIRVSEETKELFNQLVEKEEFENKGEFLNRLLTSYQAEATKKNVSIIKPAVEAVETLTSRLLEVLNGAGAAIITKDEMRQQELDEQRKSFEETRALLQQRITTLEQESAEGEERIQQFISDKEATEGKAAEFQQQIRQLENTINDKTALVEQYKEKNDTLSSIVSEYKLAAAENKSLNDNVNGLKQENESLQRQINELKQDNQRISDANKQELQHLKDKLLIEKDAALLELKQQFQDKLEEQQVRHTAAIGGYENKVKELLSFFEHEKTATSNKTTPVSRSKAPATKKAVPGAAAE